MPVQLAFIEPAELVERLGPTSGTFVRLMGMVGGSSPGHAP